MRFKRAYIEITNICNLNCSFCKKTTRNMYEMKVSEFERAASEINKVSEHLYLHVKGEPLYHSSIDKILTICDNLNFKINITTNGTLLKKNIEILKKHKSIRQLNISLHSVESIESAKKYIDEIINYADILCNFFQISMRIWTLNNENPVQNLFLTTLEKHYNKKIDLKLSRITLKDNIFMSFGEVFEWPSPLLEDFGENGYCLGTREQIAVLSNGNVVPCCLDDDGLISFGNIFNDNIEEILERPRFKNMYNGFSNRKITENLCRHCSFRLRFNK